MIEVDFLVQEEAVVMSVQNPWDVDLFDNIELDK